VCSEGLCDLFSPDIRVSSSGVDKVREACVRFRGEEKCIQGCGRET
jgi:hypothetical protein